MRQETQRWNEVAIYLEAVQGSLGEIGFAPTVALRRDDGLYLQAGGGSWGAGYAVNTMLEVDATNLPGTYRYAIPLAQLSPTAGGYLARIEEPALALLEHVRVAIAEDTAGVAAGVWDTLLTSHTGNGTFGKLVQVIAGMVQVNHRLRNPVYDAEGRLLSCELRAYANTADAAADASPLTAVFMDMVYDGDGNLVSLLARE